MELTMSDLENTMSNMETYMRIMELTMSKLETMRDLEQNKKESSSNILFFRSFFLIFELS